MSENEARAQRQRQQDERRLSSQRNNAYFSVVSAEPNRGRSITPNLTADLSLLTRDSERSCSPSPSLLSIGSTQSDRPRSATPDPLNEHLLTANVKERSCSLSPSPLPTKSAHTKQREQNLAVTASTNSSIVATTSITKTTPMPSARSTHTNTTKAAQSAKQTATNENENAKPAIQTGMDRYIQIKRKLSPQKNVNKPKITRANANTTLGVVPNNANRFDILADTIEDLPVEADGSDKNRPKPPPIFVREKSSSTFVNNVIKLIGDANFHIIPLVRGNIHETKVQTKSEQHFRALTKYLDEGEKSYYTYQLKSSKGLQVVLKGIEPDVTPDEIKLALQDKGFTAKSVFNILNKNRQPQPLFKVELAPEAKMPKRNDVHPIYKLQFLLHRRITVEEPHKRNNLVQCMNCQEYGHTKSYCKLRPVCVVCGELHDKASCSAPKKDSSGKRCGNCGGNHTANYRGCPVYKELKSRINQRVAIVRSQNAPITKIPSKHNPEVFFSTAARSSLGTGFVTKNASYASALRSGLEPPASNAPCSQSKYVDFNPVQDKKPTEQQQNKFEEMILTLQQSMAEFMAFMRTTMQDLMRNQNMLIQLLVSQHSK